ncbi:MAG: histidinol-phosphate transaminase [Lentisphaerae bacterium]|nr:histidinol-phosphate transaminase [Lentisphaerota bacterium]
MHQGNTNENPYPPSPLALRALMEAAADTLRLYPDPLCGKLRETVAGLHGVTSDRVFFGNGSDEILALCTRAFVEDDGSIGFFDPSYSLYRTLAQIRNAKIQAIALDADCAWPAPDPETADLFLLTNPNAPSGRLYPEAQVEDFCRRARGVVVIDEAYVDFAAAHCMDLAQRLPNVLVMRSLSKSYSLAGLRAGYAVGNPDLIAALFKIKDSYNVNRLTQAAALAALRDQAHMLDNVRRIKATRQKLAAELTAMGFQVHPSEANFLWVKPARPAAQRLYELLKDRKILVRYFPGTGTGEHLRITIGNEEQTERLLAALRAPELDNSTPMS